MRIHASLAILVGLLFAGCSSTRPETRVSAQPVVTPQQEESGQTFTVAIAKDQSISVEGATVSVADLTTQLSELGGNGSQPVMIRAHREVPHSAVKGVLEALTKAGYAKVSFATKSD